MNTAAQQDQIAGGMEELDPVLVQQIQDYLTDHEELMQLTSKQAFQTMKEAGLPDPVNQLNADHEEYNEGMEALYYKLQGDLIKKYVIEALRAF